MQCITRSATEERRRCGRKEGNLVVKNSPVKQVVEFLNHGRLKTREVLFGRRGGERGSLTSGFTQRGAQIL